VAEAAGAVPDWVGPVPAGAGEAGVEVDAGGGVDVPAGVGEFGAREVVDGGGAGWVEAGPPGVDPPGVPATGRTCR
jgi:hypothetical protein